MKPTTFFTVAEDWQGNVAIHSFLGRNKTEERRYCLSCYKKCHGIYTVFAEAEAVLREVRASLGKSCSRCFGGPCDEHAHIS